MTKALQFLWCILLFSTPAMAQEKKFKPKFGKISAEEMAMASFKDDPAAAAVVLFDKGEYTHNVTIMDAVKFNFEYERHIRIKIFNKDAYKYADIRLIYYKNERITDLKASSYNLENGQIVETKLEKENIFDERLTNRIMVKKLTIPAVREGTIIEYKYTLHDSGLPDWLFQRLDIPTVWSEFKASVPTFVEYRKFSRGWVPFTLAEEEEQLITAGASRLNYKANVMHFIQENIPALKPEPFVQSPGDYLSRISFDIQTIYNIKASTVGSNLQLSNLAPKETKSTWQDLGRELLEESFNDHLNSSRFDTDALACVTGKTGAADKIAAIYEFIGKNYQITNHDYLWTTESPETIAKNRKGSPTDINLVFIDMLRKAKINVYPLLVSTRKNGRVIPYRVSTDAFDRLIAAVENEDKSYTLIDVAGWPNPIGLLPESDLNGDGLLLKAKDLIDWIPLQNKLLMRSAVQADFEINPDGAVAGNVSFSETGYGATAARQMVKTQDTNTFIQEKFKNLLADGACKNVKTENFDRWQEPNVKGSFDLEASGFATASNGKIYLLPTLGFGLKENPFKDPERKFDVQLGTSGTKIINIVFKIPAGYKVEELPKSTKMTFGENDLLFEYFAETTPENLKITVRQSIRQPYISVDQYADLQQFYGSIVSKLQEHVVLTKI